MDAFELAMPHDLGIGIVDLQGAEQGDEGCTLGRSAGVGRTALSIQSAFIADADGVGIIVAGVHTHLFFCASLIDLAIALNVIVVADAFAMEAGIVAATEHFDGKPLVAARSRTVNNNQINLSHIFIFFIHYTLFFRRFVPHL